MIAFLLIVSFLLHIILIFAVYSLYQQMQQDKLKHKEEIEQLLAQFLEELHRENDMLETKIKQNQSAHDSKETEIKRPVQKKEPLTMEEDNSFAPILDKLMEEQQTDVIETSIEAKIIKMFENGATTEEIARKLNRGKTEVELIVKLHHK